VLTQKSTLSRAFVEDLLAEGVQAARAREVRAFDDLAAPVGSSILLFGAGGLGRRCLAGLRRHGIKPVAFADNNPKLWDTQVEGIPVLSPADAAKRFGASAVFVITIWGALASDRMSDRERQLRSLGCEKVIPFGPLFWKYPEHVLPHYGADVPHKVIQRADDVLRAFDLWSDDESRREYIAQLKWRLFFDFETMAAPARDAIYFPDDLVKVREDEVFVDCGAFDGDTVNAFLAKSRLAFKRIFAFEPDPVNFARLSESVANLPKEVRARIDLKCAALSALDGAVSFSAQGSPSSFVGEGELKVEAVTMDRYVRDASPTFIKMDIEGAEPEALIGATNHIRETSPLLAVSCYHRQDHLWSIPLLIRSLNPGYTFYLRPHDLDGWDLVCYGIPRSRIPHRVR
jgi:FkbM family methyltransferase